MKSKVRHYTPVALLLAVILVAVSCLSLLTGDRSDPRPRVLATTHPLYVAADYILGNTDELRLEKLSGTGAGCLHDYQLSPADRLALEQAEVILQNGAGPEPFLEGVESTRLVNTSAEIEKLSPADFWHPEVYSPEDHHGHHHEKEANNEHVWVSPVRYQKQVLAVLEALIRLDKGNEAVYRENASHYLMNIDYLWSEMTALPLQGRPCVLFHDSLAYLAEDLGLDVRMVLTFDGDSGIAAEALAEVERLAKEYPDLLLIYDTQYPIRYGGVDGLVPAQQVLALDTAVVGEGNSTDWIKAMEYNLEQLKQPGGDTP